MGRLLEHWTADVAIVAELDFWTLLLVDTHRKNILMVFVNSRISEASR
ncbi:MAG: hypothetical protein HKP37_02180 [Boseongicola sp.]|nr:hypothetical protein [Boseongicola sp.]